MLVFRARCGSRPLMARWRAAASAVASEMNSFMMRGAIAAQRARPGEGRARPAAVASMSTSCAVNHPAAA